MAERTTHALEFDKDEGGWDFARCHCGWISPPMPDVEEAAECYADHLLWELRNGSRADG